MKKQLEILIIKSISPIPNQLAESKQNCFSLSENSLKTQKNVVLLGKYAFSLFLACALFELSYIFPANKIISEI